MSKYESKDAWDPTIMTGDKPPALPEDNHEPAKRPDKGRNEPDPSRARTPWLLVVLLLTSAIAFAILEYLPLRKVTDTFAAELTTLRKENAGFAAKLATLERERDELASTHTKLQSEVEKKSQILAELTRTQEELAEKLQAEIKKGDVLIKQRGGELVVDLVDQILFDSGQAELNEQGEAVLQKVGDVFLTHADKVIQVGGHTDNIPISAKLSERFPSNWELSTARATNVVRFLQETVKVPGKRLVATGFSEYRPTTTNKTNAGRRKNRRIEVVLLPAQALEPAAK